MDVVKTDNQPLLIEHLFLVCFKLNPLK